MSIMKWINTYNNILFASLGTLSIIVLLFVAVTSLSLFRGSDADNRGINQDLVENEEGLIKDGENNIRYFLGGPELIDSSLSTYMIPVYKPEANESFSKYSSSSYRSGLRINLIIHNIESNIVKKLFKRLVLIDYPEVIRANGELYIEVVYSDSDTNDNGIIDYGDQKSIALYDLRTGTFEDIPLKNKYLSISSLYDKRLNALVIVGEDILPNEQPTYQYYRYDLEAEKVFELNNP